jgi:gamma-glutamyltranspeptidase / glutathione hydrolase
LVRNHDGPYQVEGIDMSNFSATQSVRKKLVTSKGGIVAAQHRTAAEVGAAILAAGGDAIDAAIATSFAIGVVEPWMSGPAGGGAMVIWREAEQKAYTLFFGMRSPKALDPLNYPLDGSGRSSDLFPWKTVKDDRNVQGATAIAVPGTVAGMELAHQRFAKLGWSALLKPAVSLAEKGMLVDWYGSMLIASAARDLAKDPDCAAQFLDDGTWPVMSGWTGSEKRRLNQKTLAATLARLANKGARDFYEGEIAQAMVADVQAKGGCLSLEDLSAYRADLRDTIEVPYRGGLVHAAKGLTAGPNIAECLRLMESAFSPADMPNGTSYAEMARALSATYERRLREMGDCDSPLAPSCTTHFSVVDRNGNMVAVTQTLLSIFGSKVMSPSTGLMMNNGIMWFDPEAGKPNSLAADKGCLMNICPVIGKTADGRQFALGASGGRKILPAVLNLTSFIADFGMDLAEAFHQPRIDNSGSGKIVADEDLAPDVISALESVAPTTTTKRTILPFDFACPSAVMRGNGFNSGMTEPVSPWADAAAEPSV